MVNQQVPEKTTPVSQPELVATFISVAKQLYGITLTKPQIAVLVAHVNLETGSSGAGWVGGGTGNTSMHNYNIGNITWTPNSDFDYFIGGDRTRDAQGNWTPTHFKFRSYPTLEDGVRDYIQNIHSRGGGKAWNAVLQSDPSSFSHELKQTHYYEAEEDKYTDAMNARLNQFNKGKSYEAALAGNFTTTPPTNQTNINIDDLFAKYLAALSSNQSHYIKKESMKQLLPHDYLIKIQAEDTTNAIELARILCNAIDEELYSDAYIHSNGNSVEIQTTITGSKSLCTEALVQLSDAIATVFEKIAPVSVVICPNQQSNYHELGILEAMKHYDAFHNRIKNGQ